MQHEGHRLVGIDPLARQDAVEAHAEGAERPERVVDPRRPVHAGDESALRFRLVAEPAEGGLDDAGNSVVVVVGDLAIVEALHLAAGGRETRLEMLPAYAA